MSAPNILPPIIPGNLTQFRPVSDITAFTERTGMSYQALLESLRRYTVEYLTQYLADEFDGMEDAWETNAAQILTGVDTALNAAVQQVITASIPVSDALLLAVLEASTSAARDYLDGRFGMNDTRLLGFLDATSSASRDYLDGRYNLTDAKLLYYLNLANDGNPSEQVRARLDQLYALTSSGILGAVNLQGSNDSPFRNWMDARYVQSDGTPAYWTPGWGGDTGASLGNNGATQGKWITMDGHIDAKARLVFGSSAVWGGGVLTGVNAGGGIDDTYTLLDGMYFPVGGTPIPVKGYGIDSSDIKILAFNATNGWVPIGLAGIPNPPQSSTMIVHVTGVNP